MTMMTITTMFADFHKATQVVECIDDDDGNDDDDVCRLPQGHAGHGVYRVDRSAPGLPAPATLRLRRCLSAP